MRLALAFLIIATPASAWEFTPGLPCLLTHEESGVAVRLTHDPTRPLFSITVSRAIPWPEADLFAIRFDGASGLTITTNRHQLDETGKSLTVTDHGFGNVLDGLSRNDTATALIGGQSVQVSLTGAAGPVQAFEACAAEAGV